jgi:hypothetical protein
VVIIAVLLSSAYGTAAYQTAAARLDDRRLCRRYRRQDAGDGPDVTYVSILIYVSILGTTGITVP